MSNATHDLEQDLQALTAEIADIDRQAAEKHEAAEQIVATVRAAGRDPLKEKAAFDEIDAAFMEADTLKELSAEKRRQADRVMEWLGSKKPATSKGGVERMSVSDRMIAGASYQRALASGLFTSDGRLELDPVEALSREQLMAGLKSGRGLWAATVDAEPVIAPDQSFWPPVPIPVRQLRIVDLLTTTTTDSNLIQYTRMKTRTDVAAPTAKGTSYPEATYEFEDAEAPVRDIGQWIPAHRSELADRGQLQALLEQLLSYGVEFELEEQVLNGDGVGQNLEGILETTGINSVTRDTTNERRLETFHRGITAIRLDIYAEPNGIGVHPSDYEQTLFEGELDDTGKDKGNYLWPAAVTGATPRTMWGLPVAITPAFTEGQGLVADFRWATVYIRSGVTTRASDSHSDYFTRRMVAILAEMRAALAVKLPSAFCEVNSI